MDAEPDTELERLRRTLVSTEAALHQARRELFDSQCRLALIAKILNNPTRHPAATSAAVRAVLPNRGRFTAYPRRST